MDEKNKQIPPHPQLPQLPAQANAAGVDNRARGLKYFNDTLPLPAPVDATGKAHGKSIIKQLWSLLIGAGTTVFASDISGIWLGSKKWANAPFRVDMAGNLFATSVSILGGSLSGVTLADYLAKAGGTMLGFLTLFADPVNALHAATKQYVDSRQAIFLNSIVTLNDEVIINNGDVVYTV
jgi:hypothetical protein